MILITANEAATTEAYKRDTELATLVGSKNGAFLMLAVVILWTAAPGFACLSGTRLAGQPDCCRGMALNCPMRDAGLNATCCPTHSQDSAVTPDPSYSPEHSQKLCLAPHDAGLVVHAKLGFVDLAALKTPPPKLMPGGSSILRI